ncbi:peptidase S41 [Corallococcus praedator]|uniref:Peptidase S41 n=1 Tax=Corallococcus praedator TaxID=2316724 RepID=A0ABX9QDL2_9BACT|nr:MULTISPECIES: S41 family peptidase [Corallococcus]RKH23055.1 peptidase S41 [Corallococcus sp. CA031C]RKH99852.1 peptidase S41 [Corallococcus praedator]
MAVQTARWLAVAGLLMSASVHAAPGPYTKLGDEVVALVRTRFHDAQKGAAWADAHQGYAADVKDAEDFARRTNAALAELKVSHTTYYPKQSPGHAAVSSIFQGFLKPKKVEATGIGADVMETPDGFFVRHVFVEGPAAKAGLLRGDRLLTVEGQPFHPWRAFANRAGRATRLTVERTKGAEPLSLTVTPRSMDPRKEWLAYQKASSRVVEHQGRRVAYQHLFSCAGEDHQQLLEETLQDAFADAEALVVDFRDGWGGCSPAFVNLFNPQVPTMVSTGRDGKTQTLSMAWHKPVVLLVNGNSRSGKELVAFVLKRHRLATLVGQHTAGAVMAGGPQKLSNGDLLYLAVMDGTVDGERLEGVGVPVDVEVPDGLPYAVGVDPQKARALDVAASLVKG